MDYLFFINYSINLHLKKYPTSWLSLPSHNLPFLPLFCLYEGAPHHTPDSPFPPLQQMVYEEEKIHLARILEVLVYVTGQCGLVSCHEEPHYGGRIGGVKPFILWLGNNTESGRYYDCTPDDLKTHHHALYRKQFIRFQWCPLPPEKNLQVEVVGNILY